MVGRLLAAQACVLAVLCPLGYAIDGPRALTWVAVGAAVWTLVFAFAAVWLGRPLFGWGVCGGLICGSGWGVGYVVGEWLVAVAYQGYGAFWAMLFGGFGGLGAGLLAGAATEVVPDPRFHRAVRLGSYAAAVTWGGLCAGAVPVQVQLGSIPQALGWGVFGVVGGIAALPIGRHAGKIASPIVVFFEELQPYLAEMARPLAAFATGFITLTVIFAGLYGSIWRLDPTAFRSLPATPTLGDFIEFSLMTATTGNTAVEAVSAPVRVLKA